MSDEELMEIAVAIDGLIWDGKRWRPARRTPLSLYRRSRHIWKRMVRCCTDPTDAHHPKYGGRGVRLSARWMDWKMFHRDMGAPPDAQATITRRDRSGHYDPTNVIWLKGR